MKTIFNFLFLFFPALIFAQQNSYPIFTIPKTLQENADACIRLQDVSLKVQSRKSLVTNTHRVITVFNKMGDKHLENYAFYDKVTKIKSIEVNVYDAVGKPVKKFKKKDFSDTSVADGIGSITDTRRLILDFTPTQYPYTIEFKSEVETDNTAFLPAWYPLDSYFVSVENSKYSIQYPIDLGLRYKESNFDFFPIEKIEKEGFLQFEAKNVSALKREEYAPSFKKFLPNAMFSLSKFHLEGVDGAADSWDSFGKWMYSTLIVGTDELKPETIQKIKAYVGDITDPIEKSKKVFKFVQDNTRYVSIQLGIGGWKPMNVQDVDRLGYGDCKALTNYARALLKAVDVPSYYSIIYLDQNIRNIDENFVSMQGNHATLAIPVGNELCWAECTSQTVPFDFQALSTDDRNALIVDENGGRIVKTKIYKSNDNEQITKASCQISEDGNIELTMNRVSKGTQYAFKSHLTIQTEVEKKNHYLDEYRYINNLSIKNLVLNNDKEKIVFSEDVAFNAIKYAQITGDRMLLPINMTNRYNNVPPKIRNRKAPFEISRGYLDEDVVEIKFPEGYVIEAKGSDVEFTSKFGTYKASYEETKSGLIYKRTYLLNNGIYTNADYESYRSFVEQVAQNDQAKIVLKKI